MARGGFHGEYRPAGVFDKLVQYYFVVIVFAVFEAGEGTHTDYVAVATHYGDSFQQMFRLVAIHDDAAFGFQLPCSLVDVQYNDIHAQVQSGFLSTEAGTQT